MIGVDGALYQSMEFVGDGIASIDIDGRFTIANMAVKLRQKRYLPVDDVTLAYLKEHGKKDWTIYEADPDAEYERVIEIDLATIEPTVAFPHLPSNTKSIDEAKGLKIDQVVIGSCTNGRIEDLRVAASILKGRKVHRDIRCIIFPATQKIYLQAVREGLAEIFVEANVAFSTPTCGPCLGGHMGFWQRARALATTNRNFVGRMGHPESEVYLSNLQLLRRVRYGSNHRPKRFDG